MIGSADESRPAGIAAGIEPSSQCTRALRRPRCLGVGATAGCGRGPRRRKGESAASPMRRPATEWTSGAATISCCRERDAASRRRAGDATPYRLPRYPCPPPQSSPPTLSGPRRAAPLRYESHVGPACPHIPDIGEDRAVVRFCISPMSGRKGRTFGSHSSPTPSPSWLYLYPRCAPSIERAQCPSACLQSVREAEERRALVGAVPRAIESLHAMTTRKRPLPVDQVLPTPRGSGEGNEPREARREKRDPCLLRARWLSFRHRPAGTG